MHLLAPRSPLVLTLVLLLAAGLAACGGDGPEAGGAVDTTRAVPETAPGDFGDEGLSFVPGTYALVRLAGEAPPAALTTQAGCTVLVDSGALELHADARYDYGMRLVRRCEGGGEEVLRVSSAGRYAIRADRIGFTAEPEDDAAGERPEWLNGADPMEMVGLAGEARVDEATLTVPLAGGAEAIFQKP